LMRATNARMLRGLGAASAHVARSAMCTCAVRLSGATPTCDPLPTIFIFHLPINLVDPHKRTKSIAPRPQRVWTEGVIPANPDAWVWLGDMVYMDEPLVISWGDLG
jgi:hypothetical protein